MYLAIQELLEEELNHDQNITNPVIAAKPHSQQNSGKMLRPFPYGAHLYAALCTCSGKITRIVGNKTYQSINNVFPKVSPVPKKTRSPYSISAVRQF